MVRHVDRWRSHSTAICALGEARGTDNEVSRTRSPSSRRGSSVFNPISFDLCPLASQ